MRAVGGARAGENTKKPSISPQAPRRLPKSGARANKRAPPFEKKGGGQGARAPSGGACADTSSKRSAEKRTALDTPKQQAQWGVPAPRTNNKRSPRKKKTLFLGVFLRPPTPRTPYGTPPKAFLEKA